MRLAASRQWMHLVLVVALVGGIAGLAQAIAERHSIRFDLTPTREFSLTPQTRRVLDLLSGPIEVTVFYRREDFQKTADLMALFQGAAPAFRYTMFDLDRYPGRARQDGVDRYGKAVIRHRGERVIVDVESEQSVAGGLLRLVRGRPTRVLFLTGHGERDFTDVSGPIGYGELRQVLRNENYEIGTVNLAREGRIPDETDLVIVAGPRNDLLEEEAERLHEFLAGGGHLLAMIDPVPLPNLERLAARYGIEVSLDILRDPSNQIMGSDPFTIPIPGYLPHPITDAQRTPAIFAVARSVSAGGSGAGTIAQSYPEAWAIRDFERAGKPGLDPREPEDRRGPIPVMAAASRNVAGDRQTRIAVVGDSDFAANGFLNLLGNRDLAMNTISWLVSAESLIGERSGSRIEALRPLSPLVLSGQQGRWIFFLVVVVQPAAVLLLGSFVALRRRWRG